MITIICEGESDKEFINLFLAHLKQEGKLNPLQEYKGCITSKGGKSKLLAKANYTQLTKRIDNNKVKKVLFIFDADFSEDGKCNGLKNSKKCVEKLIKDLAWNIETDYYIFDKNLDNFIINTLSKEQQKCFEEFDECLEIEDKNKNKKISTCIYKKLYPQSPYDFSHKNFDELKQKLTNLF